MFLYKNKNIHIGKSNRHGWGVFAIDIIKKNDIIEECNIIVVDKEDINGLKSYLFCEKINNVEYFIPIGLCSCLNSSINENVYFTIDVENRLIVFKAKLDIEKNEELLIYYGFK